MSENTLLRDAPYGILKFDNTDDVDTINKYWKDSKEIVDYPVWIVPAYYRDEDQEKFVLADGESGTGRDKEFHLVVVDKLRDGNKQAISTVTGSYGTLNTSSVYDDLHCELVAGDVKHCPTRVWVSGNGGQQQLYIHIKDVNGMSGVPDDIRMYVRLSTSVDGTKAHSMQTIIHNKNVNTNLHIHKGDFKLAARHTSTVGQRTFLFSPTIREMIVKWNEVIIPTMQFMYDYKFNPDAAIRMIEKLCKNAGIGERHTIKIKNLYKSGHVKTNDSTDSLYKINLTIGKYVDENMEGKIELKDRFKDNLAKEVNKVLSSK